MNLDNQKPDIKISVRQTFNLDSDMEIDGFSKKNKYVPEIDSDYKFDRDTTLAILSGFAFNKKVLIICIVSSFEKLFSLIIFDSLLWFFTKHISTSSDIL